VKTWHPLSRLAQVERHFYRRLLFKYLECMPGMKYCDGLDIAIWLPNKISSSVQKVWQGFDQRTNEHVFVLHHRIKVNPGKSEIGNDPCVEVHTLPCVKSAFGSGGKS